MAIAMINDIDKNKFKEFLVKYTSECTSKVELAENFKNEIPDISEDNLFEKLTEKYIEILRYEGNKPDKRRKKSIVQRTSISSNVQLSEISQIDEVQVDDNTNDIQSMINNLNKVVNSLINMGRRIASRQSRMFRNNVVPVPILPEFNAEFNEAYDELSLLYDKIDDYNSDNNTEFLNKVLTLIAKINKDSFIESKESFIITSSKNYLIHDLLSLIQEYQQN